jgi:sugar phosphate isomerase/epimerase
MQVGIKLDLDFSVSAVYRRLYGDRDVLACLRGLGIEAAETPVGPDTDTERLKEHFLACRDAGLQVSLHPYTEGTACNPARFSAGDDDACHAFHRRLLELAAEGARLQGCRTIINIHAAAGSSELSRSELVERSVRFFRWAGRLGRASVPEVLPVAELQIRPNPNEPIQRIGDVYDELLHVVEHSGCGACWDFGHAVMNARRFGLPRHPPGALLSRIVHVHCHDVDRDDHQPLIFGNVPWREFLGALGGDGFDGAVILEVPPDNLLAAGGLSVLERSVRDLRSI